MGRTLPLIAGNAVSLRQLVLALVGELSKALGHTGGTIQFRTSLAELDTPPEVVLEIDATPAPPSAEDRFSQLFPTADSRVSGNHAAAAIVDLHHGHFSIERNAAGGARIRPQMRKRSSMSSLGSALKAWLDELDAVTLADIAGSAPSSLAVVQRPARTAAPA